MDFPLIFEFGGGMDLDPTLRGGLEMGLKICPMKTSTRDLFCASAVYILLYSNAYNWADLVQTCCLGPLAMSRMLSLRLIHAMHALTSRDQWGLTSLWLGN